MKKKYETGIETRKLILKESRKLFLEKGFRNTSYDDICKAAHVNRGSIYYHFKQKDNLRYEILWDLFFEYKKEAASYTAVSSEQYIFTLYLIWNKILTDKEIGRFFIDYYTDFPVYSPDKELSIFITTLYKNCYNDILPLSEIDLFDLASMYGYLGCISQMVKQMPGKFSIDTLFPNILSCCFRILRLPQDRTEPLLQSLSEIIARYQEAVVFSQT